MSNNIQDNQVQDTDTSQLQRVFIIGDTRIVENETLVNLTNEEAQHMLAFTYPEVENAKVTTSVQNGQLVIEFMNRPGKKG
ncbi:MAG: PRTRC system protein C [Chloroflexota bacterium]